MSGINVKWPSNFPVPPPPTPPKPTEDPPVPVSGLDVVPMSDCVFYGGDPSKYPIMAQLTKVEVRGTPVTGWKKWFRWGYRGQATVTVEWIPPAKKWPKLTGGVVGNDWIGVRGKDGLWHCGVWEMTRGEDIVTRLSEAEPNQPPFVQAHGPVANWCPRPGDEYVYMRSTVTRGTDAARERVHERTQIVKGVWR